MDRYTLRRISSDGVPRSTLRLFDPEVDEVAAKAIADIRENGESALRSWAERLGEIEAQEPLLLGEKDLQAAYERADRDDVGVLERARGRVAAFAAAQRASLRDLDMRVPGGRAGHVFVPVARAGCYVPGGRYPLPSSAIMTVTAAASAGVKEIWCAGPHPTDLTLTAAYISGAKGFLRCGGAHAVAALAFGAAVPPCDVVVGPGGRFVASAKRQLFGVIGMEALAGPSELLIIADNDANPNIAAADLIAQAEHDTAAVPMLICASENFAVAVEKELAKRLASMPEPNRSVASAALDGGWILVERDAEKTVEVAETCAPEHLELLVLNPDFYASRIHSAGAVFMGEGSAEVFGDYGAGPNHTLPTSGTSKFASGLSVLQFLRARTWLKMDKPSELAGDTAAFARIEGLEGHARAAEART